MRNQPAQRTAAASPSALEPLEPRVLFAVFTVTNTLDGPNPGPAGSLRRALNDANANAGADQIRFNIPGPPGVKTISPTSALPAINGQTDLDGTTQPGFAGTPLIEITGALAGAGVSGLTVNSGNSVVRGLVINRFTAHGITLGPNGANNTIAGNYIGTDASGNFDRGNGGAGINVGAGNTIIGGGATRDANVISGNDGVGIAIISTNAVAVSGNRIGTNAAGTGSIPNGSHGVLIRNSTATVVGSVAPTRGPGNVIAFNGASDPAADGVSVISGTASILANSIFRNRNLGIDLHDNGVTPNDAGDPDSGANNLLNYPVLNSAVAGGGPNMTVTGTINSTPNTTLTLSFYSSPAPDPSGFGEGQKYLSDFTVTTDAAGNAAFSAPGVPAVPVGHFVTATSTLFGALDRTSEFSGARQVTAPPSPAAPNSPRINAVFVNSTAWTEGFYDHLTATGLGSDYGLLLPAVQQNDKRLILPYSNINQISVRFDQHLEFIELDDLQLRGVNQREYEFADVDYDPLTNTVTWTRARTAPPVGPDWLTLVVDGDPPDGVRADRGPAAFFLDGEFRGTFPSGDGAEGGDFVYLLGVMPGDADGNGVTDVADLGILSTHFGQTPHSGRGGDFTGDAIVDVADLGVLSTFFGKRLPEVIPAAGAGGGGSGASSDSAGALLADLDRRRAARRPASR